MPNLNKPVIAAVNGICCGGGLEWALSADIILAAENATFALPEIKSGIKADAATIKLPKRIPYHIAMELLFTGRVVESEEAYKIGLLNHLVPSDKLMETALGIANQIAENDDRMVQGVKDLMLNNVGEHWKQMFQNELSAQKNQLAPTPVLEGFKEFLDRKGKN